MFKLLRLEDRIVLDGAAMDAIHQKEQQDRHQYDLIMQAQGDHTSDHHLTPDAHQADVGVHDSGHDGTHTGLDTHQPLFLADVTDAGNHDTGLHVLVISSNIKDADTLAAAAKDDVMVIRYDAANTSIDDLATLIHNALGGKKADSIAFATHNGNANGQVILTGTDTASLDTLNDPHQQAFWKSIGSDLSDNGRIDLLACNVTADSAGEQFVSDLQHIAGKTVAASSDITGNAAHGGDWTLETGHVDVTKVYFDDHRIDSYDGVLAGVNHFYNDLNSSGGFNILDNQSAERGVFTRFSFSNSTFYSSNGTITYTVTGKPSWLTWYETDRVFYGTPPTKVAVQSSYTITVTANDGTSTDSLSFTLKVANAGSETGQHVPIYSGDPTNEFFITEGTPVGTLLTPNMPITAIDADSNIAGYRFVSPTGVSVPFAIGSDGTISSASASLTPGKYYLTVEASDTTLYQDTAHVIVNVVPMTKPGAWLTFNQSSFAENGGTVTLTANLNATSAAVTTLNLNFAGGATFGTDYLAASNIITVPAGSLSSSMAITGQPDLLNEGNESIIVSITGPAGVNLASQYTPVTATIVDNTPPQVGLSLSNTTFSEKGGSTVLTATMAGTSSTDVHVNLSFGGQATLNTDYSVTNTMITIPAGQASAAITVTGLKDTPLDTGNETIVFTGTSTDAPINPASSVLTATIIDFDFASLPTVSVSFSKNFIYENESAILNFTLQNTSGFSSPITVYYSWLPGDATHATLGTDYNVTPDPAQVTINPMVGGASVTVNGVIDNFTETTDLLATVIVDPNKTVDANIGVSTGSILVKDYTVPRVHLNPANAGTVLEGNVATTAINMTLTDPSDSTRGLANPNNQVNVFLNASGSATPGYAASAQDYNLYYDSGRTTPVSVVSGQYMVTFAPGTTLRTLYVEALTDVYIEGTENLTFNIATVGYAAMSADAVTMQIVDANSSGANVSLSLSSATFAESGAANSTVLDVNLSEPIQGIVTAYLNTAGTAALGTDYTISGATVVGGQLMVTIPASHNVAHITLIGKTDSVFDPNETATFTLSSAVNAAISSPTVQTATIVDNFNVPTVSMAFGSTFHEALTPNSTTLTINLSGANSAIQSGTTVNMQLTPVSAGVYGYATPPADYSLGGPAVWNTAGYYTVPVSSLTTITIPVTGVSDSVLEPMETAGLIASFANSGTLASAFTNIIDDNIDTGNNVYLGTVGAFAEAGGSATMKVFMKNAVATDTTVALAYGGVATPPSGTPADSAMGKIDYTVAGSKDAFGTIVTIPAGQTSATLTFTSISDGAATPYYEGNETLTVAVSSVSSPGYTVNPSTTIVTGTITEQQAIPTVSLTYAAGYSATFPENPNAGAGLLALTIPYPSQMNTTINLSYTGSGSNPATLNTDYTAQTMGIIMAGATSGNVPLYGKDDPILEPNMVLKASVLNVVSGGGATAGATPSNLLATVMDDDATRGAQVYILTPPGFSSGFTGLTTLGQFSEGANTTFTVGLDRTISNVATVELTFGGVAHAGTVGGQDYTVKVNGTAVDATTGKVQFTFQPGESRATVTVSAIADNYFETMGETLTVNVNSATSASPVEVAKFMTNVPVYTATIMDTNTLAPKVTIVPIVSTFAEGDALKTGTLAVRLDKIMTEGVTVNLAIQQPYVVPTDGAGYVDAQYYSDYQADQPYVPATKLIRVVIPANQSQQVVVLQGSPDSTYEGNETVRLTIDNSGDIAAGKISFVAGTSDTVVMTEVESLPVPTAWLNTTGATVTFGESGPAAGFSQTLAVNLSSPSVSDTTVALAMWGTLGTVAKAGAGVDYSAGASSSTLPLTPASQSILNVVVTAGSTQTMLTLTALTDGLTEGDEYIAPIVTTNASPGSPYSIDNTTSPIPQIKLIDSNFTAPNVYISGIDGGTKVYENQFFGTPVVKVDINQGVAWSSGTGFVGVVTLTLGDIAHYSAGAGLTGGQDYSVQIQYQGDMAVRPIVPVTDGKIQLTFQDIAVTEAYIKFYGISDSLYEHNGSETINIGVDTSGLTNVVTAAAHVNDLVTTMMMWDSNAKPTVALTLTPPNATLYEHAGDTVGVGGAANKSGTVSVSLSTPTSESLTITLNLGAGSQGAFYDSTGVAGPSLLGTVDYITTTVSGGSLTFTSGNAGGPWTQTFTIPAGVTGYDLFTLTTKDDAVYEGPETISVTVQTIGGTFDATGGGFFSTSVSGATATIAESDTGNKPYIKMAFDKTVHISDGGNYSAYTVPYYFSEGGGTSDTMKLSLFLTDATGGTFSSASNTTVLLTFDKNGTATAYDNPPDGATPQYTAGAWSYGTLNTMPGYAYDYSESITGGGQLTMTGYSSGAAHSSAGSATYTMLVVIPSGFSQYDVALTGYKDGVLEGTEGVIVQLASTSAVTGAYASSTFQSVATLLDSDISLAPQVSLSFVQSTFAEGGNAQLMAYFSAGTKAIVQDSIVTLNFSTGTGFASYGADSATWTSGKDFYAFGNTLPQIVIPRGGTAGYLQLNGMTDGIFEGDETVTVSIGGVSGAIQSSGAVATGTLIDADKAPAVTLSLTGYQAITEANVAQSATITLYLSKSAANPVTANLSFSNGGNTNAGFATGGDFHAYNTEASNWGSTWSAGTALNWTATPIVFSAGQTSATLYFTADADTAYEGQEKLVVAAVASSGSQFVTPGAAATQTVTIIDSNHLDVQLFTSGTTASFAENGAIYPFTVGLYSAGSTTIALTSPVVETVTLTFTGGSASYTAPVDYQVSTDGQLSWVNVGATGSLALTIPAGNSAYQVYLKGVDDSKFEPDEFVTMGLVTASCQPTNAGLANTVITATIVDDDPKTYVKLALGNNIAASTGVIAESGGNTLVRAMLVGPDGSTGMTANSDITVNLGFTAGDTTLSPMQASQGVDYTYGSSYIVIPRGFTEAVSPGSINALNDNFYEGPETFLVGVKNVPTSVLDGAVVSTWAGDQVKTVFIADDDQGPTVSIAITANASFAENNTAPVAPAPASATLTVYLASNATYGYNTSPANEYVFLDISGIASYGATSQYTQGADFFLADAAGNTIGATTNPAGKLGYPVTISKGASSASYYLKGVNDGQAPIGYSRYEGDETLSISLGTQSSGTYYSNLQTNTSASSVVATVIDDDQALARTVSFNQSGNTIAESYGSGTNGYPLNLQVSTGAYDVTVNFQVIPSHTAAATSGTAAVASDGAANANGEDFDVQILTSGTANYYTSGLSLIGGATFSAGQTAANFSLVIPSSGTNTGVQVKLGIFDDKLYEPNETFTINIVSVVGGMTQASVSASPSFTGTIIDNDTPIIKIEVDQSQPGVNDLRAPDWQAGHTIRSDYAYSPYYVVPKDGKWNGHYYMATSDGVNAPAAATTFTTGTVEPTWGTGGNVIESTGIIWVDMGTFDQQWTPGMTVKTGTMIIPTDPNMNGHYYVATNVGAGLTGTTGTSEPAWAAPVDNGITWTDWGSYNNYIVEGDAQTTGARYFKITKNVDTSDGVLVDWYLNTSPTAGHAASASDYSSGSVISGTAILPAQAGSIVVPYSMTVTADQAAESNSNGYKDTDIVIGIKNVRYFSPPNSTFTQANLAAVNYNYWADAANVAVLDGTQMPTGTFGNAYAEKYVGIYDDDFYPGDKGTGANAVRPLYNEPVPAEPSMSFGGLGYTVGNIGTGQLTQGGYVAISTGALYFKDIDQLSLGANVQSFDRLEYTVVTAPTKGTLFVDYNKNGVIDGTDTVLLSGKTFYEGSISGVGTYGQLTYLHGGGEQAQLKDSFTFTVSDGVNVSYKAAAGISTSATSGPWVFGITAQDKNDPPVYDNQIFWVDENATGSVYITSNTAVSGTSPGTVGYIAADSDDLAARNDFYPTTGYYTAGGYSGSYIVKDAANYAADGTTPLFTLVQTPTNTTGYISGSKLALQVNSPLDYEGRDAYVVHVKLYDSSTAGGSASGGYHDAWIQIKVNDLPDAGYAPIGVIPDTTVLSSKSFVYPISSDVFPGASAVKVESFYANPALGSDGKAVTSWLHFESTSNSFWSLQSDPNRPTTSQDFVITVKATYYYQNGDTKNASMPVTSSFTLHYSLASMDLDAVMDALQYLDTDGEQFLPADGDQVPVQDMMARADSSADAAQEVSEVLALLDAEAYAFDEAGA